MLRISRLTDYATVILGVLAAEPGRMHTATAVAARTRIGSATASKLLKQLHRAALVTSSRGLHGGYQLARPASEISARLCSFSASMMVSSAVTVSRLNAI